MKIKNIFSDIPEALDEEFFENILSTKNIKVERIISRGHTTPIGEWYDQDKSEFVLVLRGSAELLFEKGQVIRMSEGDYITIPAHVKHRVEKTDEETVWLTIFY